MAWHQNAIIMGENDTTIEHICTDGRYGHVNVMVLFKTLVDITDIVWHISHIAILSNNGGSQLWNKTIVITQLCLEKKYNSTITFLFGIFFLAEPCEIGISIPLMLNIIIKAHLKYFSMPFFAFITILRLSTVAFFKTVAFFLFFCYN